jgi:DNA-binding transcriptional ArsR family regulator
MSRAATTTDGFNAIAELGRRNILDALIGGEVSVGDLVEQVHMSQPQVSKHLAVLRTVDLVHFRTVGRQRRYRVNGTALKPIYDWLGTFEGLWNERFDRLDDYLTQLQETELRKEENKS